jgi:alpha-glucosidase (family GH31 glycosyl hydrolase)
MSFYKPAFQPVADPRAVVQSGKVRFTVLKDRLIRLEYDADQVFEDRPSQVFWYRAQPLPEFKTWKENGWLHIETSRLYLSYKINGEFFWRDLNIVLKETGHEWHFGDADFTNLKGTTRTLDRADGPIPLDNGLISCSGWSLVNDSTSLVFSAAGWLQPRNADPFKKDFYFFGYGKEYLQAIQDYQALSGKPGLLPRWALGNWWSRFWNYTQEDLSQLMLDFEAHRIPLSVCIVDMDWHITKTGNASSGWTGYTWNKALFPDPYGFVRFLHDHKLHTALNLHPAEGVHSHEEAYPQMASALGVDPATKKSLEFDIANEIFTEAYFALLHHPMEAQGIDFWWMDWQQGTKTKTAGLDPLYWLNHLHYYDLGRDVAKRPFVFSRWPGLGGHRYPIGFSGDSIVSWETLAFQPYFTATASNVAFGWWSHDIGGHCEGIENDELYLRWVQYGVFSPIFRLHSTNNHYCERIPWKHGLDVEGAARHAMQLRHRLIPLLYNASWKNATTGEPPILPLYYRWPDASPAYSSPQSYLFCEQILVAPFTRPMDPSTGLSRQVVWLPRGDWYNFFTGEYLQGGSWTVVYGRLQDVPAFIAASALIPMNADGLSNGAELPTTMLIRTVPGKASSFSLYEDDGNSQDYQSGESAITEIHQELSGDTWHFSISPLQGSFAGALEFRNWQVEVFGITAPISLSCQIGGENLNPLWNYDEAKHILRIDFGSVPSDGALSLKLQGVQAYKDETPIFNRVESIIEYAQSPSIVKQLFLMDLPKILGNPGKIMGFASKFTESQLLAIFEAAFNHQSDPIPQDTGQAYSNMMNTFNALMRS